MINKKTDNNMKKGTYNFVGVLFLLFGGTFLLGGTLNSHYGTLLMYHLIIVGKSL